VLSSAAALLNGLFEHPAAMVTWYRYARFKRCLRKTEFFCSLLEIAMDARMKIRDVTGPYREPREQVFSYDYSIQRASWPTAQAVRVKVAIPEELDVLRSKILGAVAVTPGQQLMISKLLSRHIADEKFRIADTDGMLAERRDTVVAPFTGPLVHLFPRLNSWAVEQRETLRAEIKKLAGL
jgi:hypothetical protein